MPASDNRLCSATPDRSCGDRAWNYEHGLILSLTNCSTLVICDSQPLVDPLKQFSLRCTPKKQSNSRFFPKKNHSSRKFKVHTRGRTALADRFLSACKHPQRGSAIRAQND